MFGAERQGAIMAYLRRERHATVSALARQLYVSETTVRRDLTELEKEGLLRRSHGGAVLLEREEGEASFLVRKGENAAAKQRLAEAAVPLLQEGTTFFLDSSSTVRALATVWGAAHKTVITTGLETAQLFARHRDTRVLLPGGTLHALTGSLTGALARRVLEDLRADTFLFSCGGLGMDGSLYESSVEQGELKAAMLHRAGARILLADRTKAGRSRAYRFASLADVDVLITDLPASGELAELCHAAQVRLLSVRAVEK